MVKIAFWTNQLCQRGIEIAVFDYAYHNIKLLGNESIIFYDKFSHNNCIFGKKIKNVIRCIFYYSQPYGNIYAKIPPEKICNSKRYLLEKIDKNSNILFQTRI